LYAKGRGKVRDILQGNRRGKLIDWLKIDLDRFGSTAPDGFLDWWSGYPRSSSRFEVGVVHLTSSPASAG
jgi:hypothetical protein